MRTLPRNFAIAATLIAVLTGTASLKRSGKKNIHAAKR